MYDVHVNTHAKFRANMCNNKQVMSDMCNAGPPTMSICAPEIPL